MNYYEITKKLIGEIRPVGETNTDNDRFENLKAMVDLVGKLVEDIEDVATCANRSEFSVQRAGNLARKFRRDLTEYED